jgi:hypothetical protein
MSFPVDGGFAHPDLLDFLEAEPNLEYVIAMAKNAVLKRKAKPAMRQARRLSRQTGKTEHVYVEANYAARSWPKQRRIIIKAEIVCAEGTKPKDNPRFVITNMKQSPQWLYEEVYRQRGEIENFGLAFLIFRSVSAIGPSKYPQNWKIPPGLRTPSVKIPPELPPRCSGFSRRSQDDFGWDFL